MSRSIPSPTINAVMVAERAASFTKRSIKGASKKSGLLLALSMLDLTTLEGKDSPEKVRGLCHKAMVPDSSRPDLPHVAAVCVYPNLVATAKAALAGSNVRVASVATGFPSGQFPLALRLQDARQAVADGADEIDMVINRGAFLAGRYDEVADEIREVKRVCMEPLRDGRHPAHLKVILETGELDTLDNVRRASDLAIYAMADVDDEHEGRLNGAAPATRSDRSFDHSGGGSEELTAYAPHRPIDFIKTSTGKVQPAATMPVTLVMLEAIRDWYLRTGRPIGMKPAGGIRTAKQALHYLVMVKETLGCLEGGDLWLSAAYFRFGASTLCNDIVRQLQWLENGAYAAAYDVSEA